MHVPNKRYLFIYFYYCLIINIENRLANYLNLKKQMLLIINCFFPKKKQKKIKSLNVLKTIAHLQQVQFYMFSTNILRQITNQYNNHIISKSFYHKKIVIGIIIIHHEHFN